MRLSKSKFIAGVQCLKRLYWQVHEPELADEPSESTEAILEQGDEVGRLACLAFPGGVRVEHGKDNLEDAVRQTRELLANRKVPAIFEGAFEHGNILVRVDILQRRPRESWRLIEVKSATNLKDHYIADAGIQKHVLCKSGIQLSSVCLMHLNKDYVYAGGDLDTQRLFRIRNLNRRIDTIESSIQTEIRKHFRMLKRPSPPEVAVGRHCSYPVLCEFHAQCHPPLPADHISNLPRISARRIQELTDRGIQSIHAIPDGFPLSDRARIACTSIQAGTAWFSPELRNKLKEIHYPVYFMDFETVYPAIPRYPGMRPYSQLPFQWSVHTRRTADSALEHYEFLAETEDDPRPEFIATLCAILGWRGTITVYNQQFESARLRELANWMPERAKQIERIRSRLWDLLPVMRQHVYHPGFRGSFSLKSVSPALVPGLTYDGMDVANGGQAGLAWETFMHGKLDSLSRKRMKNSLLAYCRQDTLALAQICEALQRRG